MFTFKFKDKEFKLSTNVFDSRLILKKVDAKKEGDIYIIEPRISNFNILHPLTIEKDEFAKYVQELREAKASTTNKLNVGLKSLYPFLFDYQIKSIDKTLKSQYKGMLYNHEMGLGKTLTSMISMNEKYKDEKNPIWIICPASLMKQWQSEIFKFLKEESKIYNQSKLKRLKEYESLTKWNIISYETFRNDLKSSIELKKGIVKAYAIIDESSKLKNSKSLIYKTFKSVSKLFSYQIFLSGTPVTNGLRDINNVVNLIKLYLAGSITQYEETEMISTGWGANARTYSNLIAYRNLDLYVKRIEPVCIRMKKSEVSKELPSKTIINIEIEQSKEHYNLSTQILNELDAFSGFSLLCMLDNGIETLAMSESESSELLDFPEKQPNPKMDRLVELVEEINDQVIVFTHYIHSADNITEVLRKKFPDKVITNIKEGDKDILKTKFLNKEIDIIVATDKWAHGVSLGSIDYLINYDSVPSLETYLQRIDRIHRADSKNPKFIYNLVGDIVENHIQEILDEKLFLFKQIVDGEAGQIKKIDIAMEVIKKLSK